MKRNILNIKTKISYSNNPKAYQKEYCEIYKEIPENKENIEELI